MISSIKLRTNKKIYSKKQKLELKWKNLKRKLNVKKMMKNVLDFFKQQKIVWRELILNEKQKKTYFLML